MSKRAKAGGASKAVPLPLSDYGKARAAWRAEVQAGLGGKANPKNRSGVEVKPIYTPEDHAGDRYMDALGFPGQLPMTRGIYATMHRGRTWTQRQLIGLGVPEDYNARLKTILAHGGTAVSLIPCNSVYRGYDIDEMPIEILGTCGVTVNSVEDMEICLDGIPIGEISTALNDPSPFTLLALELAVAKRRGIPWTRISGTSNQSDYLSHFVANHMFFRLALPGARRVLLDHIAFARAARAAVEPAVDRRPAHAAGGRHAGRGHGADAVVGDPVRQRLPRAGLGPGSVPAALHVLLRHLHELLRGGGEVPCRPAHLGRPHPQSLRRQGCALVALQVPWPDLRRGPHARAAAQQHPARRGAGDGRHLRRLAVAAHRLLRRGAVGADREGGPHRHRHAEHPEGGSAPHRRDRSARRLLLRGGADRPDGGQDPRGDRAHR